MSSPTNQFSRLIIAIIINILLLGCSKEHGQGVNYVARVVTQRVNDQVVGYILSSKHFRGNEFIVSTKVINADHNCIKSRDEEVFKIENEILYKSDTIQGSPHWLPYLIIEQGKCIVSPQSDHFGSLSVTNCTLSINTDSIVYQSQSRRVNGNIEIEKIIVLNDGFLIIGETDLSSDTDQLLTSSEVNQASQLLRIESKCY